MTDIEELKLIHHLARKLNVLSDDPHPVDIIKAVDDLQKAFIRVERDLEHSRAHERQTHSEYLSMREKAAKADKLLYAAEVFGRALRGENT